MKHVLTAAVVSTLALGLAACGGTSTPSAAGSDAPATQLPTVQPCDYVDVAKIGAILGYGITKNTGTASAPSCALTPQITGGAIFQLNYQWWYEGGLADAWKKMSKSIQGTVSTIKVPGADDARLVVNATKKAITVSGFVEDGTLIQVVNGEALPKDRARLLAATKEMLAELSAGAPSPSAAPSA